MAGHSIHLQEHKDQGWEEAKENVPQVSVNLQPHSALLDRTAQQNNDNEDDSHQNVIQNSSDEEQNEPVLEHFNFGINTAQCTGRDLNVENIAAKFSIDHPDVY